MKKININTQENVRLVLFPDNQPHVQVLNIQQGEEVIVVVSLKDSITVLNLLEVSNALDHLFAIKKELHIPYLMAARSDREMTAGSGESVDIEVIAELVNSLNFEKVFLYDVHSDVSTALIKRSVNITNEKLVRAYDKPDSILIVPDAGAVKKVAKYLELNPNLTDVVYCNKVRDMENNGRLTINVLEVEKCAGRNCVIIDDLCDAGGTFVGIASQLWAQDNDPAHLTLIVTHGLFTRGYSQLENTFHDVITSNSYRQHSENSIVRVIDIIQA